MKIIGYLRVSQVADRDGDRFISPDVQRETIKRFVTGKGHTLIDVVEDLDESGGSLDRPGLDRVLERLDAGEADGLAVAYLSRLSRRVIDGLGLAQRLRDAGRALLVADLDLDTSTPTGKAMLGGGARVRRARTRHSPRIVGDVADARDRAAASTPARPRSGSPATTTAA